MIPRIIHYCWFGNNQLPKSALNCIDSWKHFFPDYEIRIWNEDNFDVNSIPYTSQAYSSKKYAFVSDYARYWILYNYGGLYFDTDVEIVRPFDHILAQGAFMGREAGTNGKVAPGLGIGFEPKHPFLEEILEEYSKFRFVNVDGSLNQKTIVDYTTELLLKKGLILEDVTQCLDGITVYPSDIFCPIDSTTGIIRMTSNTLSIHHYDCSWMDHNTFRWGLHKLKNTFNRLIYKIIHLD